MNELIFHSLAQSIVYEVNRIYHISAPEPWSKLSGSEMLVREASLLSGAKELVESSPEESQSIFKQLHIASSIELPGTPVKDTPGRILQWFTENANLIEQPYDFQALLESLEDTFSVIPSDVPGVSLYHQIRSVMAIASVLQYNQGYQMDSQEQFALYSLDFSGIQSFIYTIISKGALKALRSRSLYLSLMTEHIVDLILDACGLTRANLIYAGGGKIHLLLSADDSMLKTADLAVSEINAFMLEHFGASLYLASAWVKTNGEVLTSHHGKRGSFSEVFHASSRLLSDKKLRRYGFDELNDINNRFAGDGIRECAICGNTARLRRWGDSHLCLTCYQLENFASSLKSGTELLCVVKGLQQNGLALPSADGSEISVIPGLPDDGEKTIRVYSINRAKPEYHATRIYITRHSGQVGTLEELSALSSGINRLGVLRADVDNLGSLFASGFIEREKTEAWKNCTLAHYSALSDALTAFFQRQMDELLESPSLETVLKGKAFGQGVSVIYAGGDDVFLMGAWNDVLDAGIKIQKAFHEYSGGKLTLSAGFGFYHNHTPVIQMADDTAQLESYAKQMEGKSAIALFGRMLNTDGSILKHEYHWDFLYQNVLEEKLGILENLFEADENKGNNFLYNVLMLYRQIGTQPMAISRLAYLLARHQPDKSADKNKIDAYQLFMKKAYQWALDPAENAAFQTACLVYVYLHRTTEQEETDYGR